MAIRSGNNTSSPSSSITHQVSSEGKAEDVKDVKTESEDDLEMQQVGSIEKGEVEEGAGGIKKAAKLVYVPFIGRKVPREPYPSLDEVPLIPAATASMFSIWTFSWIQPLLVTGYQRTLQPTDLWKLPPDLEAEHLADGLLRNFNRRKDAVEAWNKGMEDGTYVPGSARKAWWKVKKGVFGVGSGDGKRTIGLAGAISDTFYYRFWSAGAIKLVGDTSQILSPLVTKALINFSTQSYLAARGVPGYTAPSVGVGVGLAFLLWAMIILASLCTNQFFSRGASTGVLARGALIAAIYRRSMVLSGKSRTTITNGKLVNHISTDVSRIDFCCGFFHISYSAIYQLVIIIILLCLNIGPGAAFSGIAFLLVTLPGQGYAMKKMFAQRKAAMVWTDKRAKLISEILGGMRVIKFFAWESPYSEKVDSIRRSELSHIRTLLTIRAANSAVALSVPGIAAVLAFLVYASTRGQFNDPAAIFTSLTFFALLRLPLMMLPMSLSTITDAYNALGRLTEVLLAEERSGTYQVDYDSPFAIQVTDADFQWEGAPPESLAPKSKKEQAALASKLKAAAKAKSAVAGVIADAEKQSATPAETATPAEDEAIETLQLQGITLQIPRGQLWAIVGPVGSGKSSLLQALVGEMKRDRGEVSFGGSLAYCSQQPWIQNSTLQANILFGQAFDQARYDQVIADSALAKDIEMLPAGDQTEIGEKGITLSGGQKARVNIARALYYNSDIVLLDDPLSAVDAHVGHHLFEQAICGALRSKTRVLVTHGLHFLSSPDVDRVICMEHGRITQQGTYADLVADREGAFSILMREFGGGKEREKEVERVELDKKDADETKTLEEPVVVKKGKALMQEEERATGAVAGAVYMQFLRAAKGHITVPLLLLSLLLSQGSQVLGSYWLIFWIGDEFDKSQDFYMGIYALLGLLQALFSFLMGLCGVFLGYNASKSLHLGAMNGIMRAPMSFFDTSPLGRIMNRFSKDVDTVDNTLNDAMRMLFATAASVFGAIVLIAIVQQYFLLVVAFILCCYFLAAQFYRESAREVKRLDNLLRSSLYAHFSESLSGMATIRAYGETSTFLKQNAKFIDIENRAYYLTVMNQRWLAVRLDFFGSLLTFFVAIFGVATRFTVSPAQTGLLLSTILGVQSAMSWMVRQTAEVENDMNSVERLLHYQNHLPQEAPATIDETKPDDSWPAQGSIEFKDVVMSYRAGLPPVLKGLSVSIGAGEKIGVVGRTGAGKSSLMMALLRIVELSESPNEGSIWIDGVDISTIGLSDLRSRIAIIPQDALLFNGTIRTNLDPFSIHDDATLWDALKRAYLIEDVPTKKAEGGWSTPAGRFSLDLGVVDEGMNLSVGERSLVSLARALVRDSKVIILDEATASVDFATDARIQNTIRTEFAQKTLLCIAHRLNTIINYDRVLVMSDGLVAEFDTPLNLFKAGGLFHSMCESSNISVEDIEKTTF